SGRRSRGSRLGLLTFRDISAAESSASCVGLRYVRRNSIAESSASCVDSQFPADPASRVPRPVARASASLRSTKYQPPSRRPQASTRNSRPIPLRGSLGRWLAPLALAERLFVVAQFDVFLRTAQLALRRPEFAPQPEHRAYAFDIQRGIARQ